VARFAIRAMTDADARAIAEWRYPGEYAFYDVDGDPRDLAELYDPARWGREYFAADDEDGALAGFFVIKRRGGFTEIGLGLRPELTGRGLGSPFLEAGVAYAAPGPYALHVATFNARAIKVYERAGFVAVQHYEHFTNGGLHPFIRMERSA
jgi:[ribosomal protein S18]-alanine N-acetyltransferase